MKIECEATLDLFRGLGMCEWCGKQCRRREPCHLVAKGQGGGRRLDVTWNLLAMGSTLDFECPCHTKSHQEGDPSYEQMLSVISRREGHSSDAIERAIWFILRLNKDLSVYRVEEALKELTRDPRMLAERELRKAGKL
jgi:hypothetical protein